MEAKMNKKRNKALIFWVIITAIPIIGAFIQVFWPNLFFAKQEVVRAYIASYGKWGIFLFILLQILQVVITPISHYTTSLMGGFLYGPLWGGVYNWIGRIIGHFIAFILARKFGRQIIKRFVDEETLSKFEYLVKGDEKTLWSRSMVLFLMIFLPFFPDDELSYLCGLADFKFRYFIIITLLGHLGGSFALAYAGAGINTRDVYFWVLLAVTFALFGLLIVFLLRLRKQSLVKQSHQNLKSTVNEN
jgi:uncharacterized membrane protein YdjX (TVP38/TMEM64 family)